MSGGTATRRNLIGIQFGAPGDIRNLGLQNPNMNTFAPKALQDAFQGHGGTYHDLESQWSEQLQAVVSIRVTVKDEYRQGENRPFSRWVQWIETKPGAASGIVSELEFWAISVTAAAGRQSVTQGKLTDTIFSIDSMPFESFMSDA